MAASASVRNVIAARSNRTPTNTTAIMEYLNQIIDFARDGSLSRREFTLNWWFGTVFVGVPKVVIRDFLIDRRIPAFLT
jgi:hypothetical protein